MDFDKKFPCLERLRIRINNVNWNIFNGMEKLVYLSIEEFGLSLRNKETNVKKKPKYNSFSNSNANYFPKNLQVIEEEKKQKGRKKRSFEINKITLLSYFF